MSLFRSDVFGANLFGADLFGADLFCSHLFGSDSGGADCSAAAPAAADQPPGAFIRWKSVLAPAGGTLLPLLGAALLALILLLPAAAWAAELKVIEAVLQPCPSADVGAQPELRRPTGASCYALRGVVENPGRRPVVDTDVYARITDASGEPVLQNRTRVGSIGDVPPGRSDFALRLAVPAGTPGPLVAVNVRARGFAAPVRTRAGDGDELLPLEQALLDQ